MSNFSEFLKQEIRLVMLRLLCEMPQYRSNSSLLASGLDQYGLSCSRDQVKTELYWLKEQGHLEIEAEAGTVLVVKLTSRGEDIACGRSRAPGIKKPSA